MFYVINFKVFTYNIIVHLICVVLFSSYLNFHSTIFYIFEDKNAEDRM